MFGFAFLPEKPPMAAAWAISRDKASIPTILRSGKTRQKEHQLFRDLSTFYVSTM